MDAAVRYKRNAFALFASAAITVALGFWLSSSGGLFEESIRGFMLAVFIVVAIVDILFAVLMLRKAAAASGDRQ